MGKKIRFFYTNTSFHALIDRTSVPYLQKMCFRVVFCFEIIAAFCFNLSSSLSQCVVIRPSRCRHHHGLNIVPKHSHYIYREQESERDIEVDFSSLSVMITLRYFNVCITTTTSRCSYFSISNLPDLFHLPG